MKEIISKLLNEVRDLKSDFKKHNKECWNSIANLNDQVFKLKRVIKIELLEKWSESKKENEKNKTIAEIKTKIENDLNPAEKQYYDMLEIKNNNFVKWNYTKFDASKYQNLTLIEVLNAYTNLENRVEMLIEKYHNVYDSYYGNESDYEAPTEAQLKEIGDEG